MSMCYNTTRNKKCMNHMKARIIVTINSQIPMSQIHHLMCLIKDMKRLFTMMRYH